MTYRMRAVCLYLFFLLSATPLFAAEHDVDPSAYRLTLPMLGSEPQNVSAAKKVEAEALYQKALESARNRQGYEAMRLIIQTLATDPDHEAARKIIRFKRHDGKWRTDWEIRQLKNGHVDHERFGWMPGEYVKRYEGGERYYIQEKRWIDEVNDARLHYEMRNGWVISSEHYDVQTNHSWEEGVRTTRRLEHLNRAWRLLFYSMVFTENQLARNILEPPSTPPKEPRHRVLVYRDRADYNAKLRELEPQISQSTGFYFPPSATAYFFPASDDMEAWTAETTRRTLFHEAAHQLFQEAKARSTAIPPKTHYWATEGLAMLLETFRIDVERNRYIIGDLYDSRIFAAKLYFEEDHFFVPSARLARFGAFDFPKDLKIYAQSAGMAYFLMFAQGGKDRAALLELLQKSYDGSARPNTLSKLLGHSCEELDKEYQAFLQVVPLE